MLQKNCTNLMTMALSSSSETTKEEELALNTTNCKHLPSGGHTFPSVSGISSVTDAKETEAKFISRDDEPTSVVRTAKFKRMKRTRCSSETLIPPGLSLSDLLDSPILQPIEQAEPSPTTGTTPLSPIGQGSGSTSASPLDSLTKNLVQNGHENILYKPVPSFGRKGLSSISTDIMTVAKRPLKASGLASSFSAHKGFIPQIRISAENPHETCSKVGQNQLMVQTPLTPVEVSSEDGYHWRKYGQKSIKDSRFPRSYYRCAHPSCPVKKLVEQSKTVTKGEHNHLKPQTVKRMPPGALLSATRSMENGPVAVPLSAKTFCEHMADIISTKDRALIGKSEPLLSISSSHKSEPLLSISSSHKSEPLLSISSSHKSEPLLASTVDDEKTGLKWNRVEGPPKVRSKLQNDKKRLKVNETGTKPSLQIVHRVENNPGGVDDGYRWCKYGQKTIKGNSHPRSYYKCQSPGCPVRKHVERSSIDDTTVISTYEGKHNHDAPSSKFNISTLSTSSNSKNKLPSVSPPYKDYDSPNGKNASDMGFATMKQRLLTDGEQSTSDIGSRKLQCVSSSLGVSNVDSMNLNLRITGSEMRSTDIASGKPLHVSSSLGISIVDPMKSNLRKSELEVEVNEKVALERAESNTRQGAESEPGKNECAT